jgi:hypothetical protein
MSRQVSWPSYSTNLLKTVSLLHFSVGPLAATACPTPQPCRPDPAPVSRHFRAACTCASSSPERRSVYSLILAISFALFSSVVMAQQSDKPAASEHDAHAQMNERGDKGMGFSQSATTHHFLLKPNGGVIQAEANGPDDTASRDNVRMHMRHIAHAFSSGDFDIPMFVHDTTPPGVPEMKRLASKISYAYQETPLGARVVITTSDAEAKTAIHKFLRFQINEHQTHDPSHAP